MRHLGTATLARFLLFLAFFAPSALAAQEAERVVTDSAGRRVEIPQRISRVLAAGPPASILLYTLAPEKMIGWVRTPHTYSLSSAAIMRNMRSNKELGHDEA